MTEGPTARLADRARRAALWLLPLTLALGLPVLLWDQGCFEQETTTFVRQYTADDGRSILQKVFDPHANDLGTYQARELSYFIDLIDAYAYPYLALLFGPGFSLPLSSFVVSIAIVTLFLGGARQVAPRVDTLHATLLVTCFVSSFCYVATLGMFYRSAKPVVAAIVVGWVFLLLRTLRQRRAGEMRGAKAAAGGLFLLAVAAGLLDRQGAFMAIVAAVLLIVHAVRTGELRALAIVMTLAAALVQGYNVLVGPWLIEALNGYSPDFSYQRVPFGELLRLPNHVLRSLSLLAQNTLLLFGGNWIVSGLAAGLLAGVAWRHRAGLSADEPERGVARVIRGGLPGGYATWILASQLLMFALMIARHGYVYRWVDHRFWYYPLPFLALLICGVLLAMNRWLPHLARGQRRLLTVMLVVVIASNVLSLGHRREVMQSGPWFGDIYPQCVLLKDSLRSGAPEPALDPAYRALFDHSVEAQRAVR